MVDEQTHSLIIADRRNKRVIQWLNQFQQEIVLENISCYSLAKDKYGFLYVADLAKNEVKRWKLGETKENEGILVAGGDRKGKQLNQLNSPNFIFIDDEQSIYISDTYNHRVMKWRKDAKEGVVVAGGKRAGSNAQQLNEPPGLIVGDCRQIYVADHYNHRIMRWSEGMREGKTMGDGNGKGDRSNQLSYLIDLSFDLEGNLYITDYNNY